MEKLFYTFIDTQFGRLLLASTANGIRRIMLPCKDQLKLLKIEFTEIELIESIDTNQQAAEQLLAYFSGRGKKFSVSLDLKATKFHTLVLKTVMKVPYGCTKSYKEIAVEIGNPGAARAVGNANRTNPIPIIIPCHRIIGSDGSLTGYGGGIDLKRKLLKFENKNI